MRLNVYIRIFRLNIFVFRVNIFVFILLNYNIKRNGPIITKV
jgi:hypothetical protein